jgi:hypothetical protein
MAGGEFHESTPLRGGNSGVWKDLKHERRRDGRCGPERSGGKGRNHAWT